MTEVIYTGTLGVGTVRFFASPLRGPDRPWHAVADLLRSAGLPRGLRRHFERALAGEWNESTRRVVVGGETLVIAPHYVAQGFVDALGEIGFPRHEYTRQYTRAAVAAMKVITDRLGLTDAESVNYMVAAVREEQGLKGPHPRVRFVDPGEAS